MRKVAIMFPIALLLQGCGHKGPLFMPPPEQPAAEAQAQPSASQAPAPAQAPSTQP